MHNFTDHCDANERYDREELVVVKPGRSQALFWPRDIAPVLRVALQPMDAASKVRSKSRKWCRPVALSVAKEEAASYQIHMKCGPYLHVCVVTHDRIDAERVEIHESVMTDEMAQMKRREKVSIPAGETLVLAPKGLHLMLVEPVDLSEDDPVQIDLKFESVESITVQAPVRRGPPEHEHGPDHQSHH